ncbi:MAG: YbaN family protein [Alphaproteobacteria bacterium]|jgi:hypothetical protein|nr:YbaN family protein [Alphaproteobacteria bacterium]
MRYVIFCFGWFNICLGVLGIFIPGLPTTVFFLTALWAFSKSSVRFHRWLYHHPTLGRTIRDWHQHKVIPLPAKIMALTLMTASIGVVFVTTSWNLGLTTALVVILSMVALFIITRASHLYAVTAAPLNPDRGPREAIHPFFPPRSHHVFQIVR